MLKLCAYVLAGCGVVGSITYIVVQDNSEQQQKAAEKYFRFEPQKDKGNKAFALK